MNNNKNLLDWINDIKDLCSPKEIHICDGSEEENSRLISEMIEDGTMIRLNPGKRPNSFLCRSHPSDVARVESRTFICSREKDGAGPTNNWKDPYEMKSHLSRLFNGCMAGRTMYIIPFCMGPIDSKKSKIGIQITDSKYAVVNMRIMTRMGRQVLEKLGSNSSFIKCLHSVGSPILDKGKGPSWPCDPENVCIAHFPEERSIISYGSGYGGNALLGKKCLALRIASAIGHDEGWLAEHMLIMGLERPDGHKSYVCAAFPSACGKTNFAMMTPPPGFEGHKVWTIGDDIAWISRSDDNTLIRAINPEAGFFGVAPGTNWKTNPNAMETISKNTIFTNVALTDDGDVWWEGMTDETPQHLIDWQGNQWTPNSGRPAAHPNSRFTSPIQQCPTFDPCWDDPDGVPITAFIFGGRMSHDMPIVTQAHDWAHGVYLASTMGSEKTAASVDQESIRRDPMAMLPFCGYDMADYFHHWLNFGNNFEGDINIYRVNWFRKDKSGNYIWPGFSQNMRILAWILKRSFCNCGAETCKYGMTPRYNDIIWKGLKFSEEKFDSLLEVSSDSITREVEAQKVFFQKFGVKLPSELGEELRILSEE